MERRPGCEPFADDCAGPRSSCGVSVLVGDPVSLWAPPGVETRVQEIPSVLTHVHPPLADSQPVTEVEVCLEPDRLVVVGRSSGRSPVPYLDPAYRATTVMPDTGERVLRWDGQGDDILVSRAHFTLRAAPGPGIVFTNGVPRPGGGLRPPMNGTRLVAPQTRDLGPGEELLIESGAAVVIRLPNRCVIRLCAR